MTLATTRWFTGLAALLVLPVSAEAQPPVRSFEELPRLVQPDETVMVFDLTGGRHQGKVFTIDERSLSLMRGGRTQAIGRDNVRMIRAVDGLRNGILMGAGVGLGTALGILAILGSADGYVVRSATIGAPVLLSGVGAVVGALIDHAHDGGRLLYVSPGPAADLVMAPIGAKNRRVLLSVSF